MVSRPISKATYKTQKLLAAVTKNLIFKITVTNFYKLPNATWPESGLPAFFHPLIYAGDFNSHHTGFGGTLQMFYTI